MPPTRRPSQTCSVAEQSWSARNRGGWTLLQPPAFVLVGLLTAYVVLITALPLGRLLIEAIAPNAEGAWLGVARDMLASRAARGATANTIVAATASALLSVGIGTLLALAFCFTDMAGRRVLAALALLPMLVPSQIAALAWIELTGSASPILQAIGLAPPPGSTNPIYSMGGIIWVMGVEHMPLVYITCAAALAGLPRDLVDAARVVGARSVSTLIHIVLPAIAPAVLAGFALAFVSALGNFGVPALLGIPGRVTLLTTLIYQRLNGFGPSVLADVAVLGVMLAALAACGLLVRTWTLRRLSVPSQYEIAGTGGIGLGRWRLVFTLVAWALVSTLSIVPLLALLASSLVPAIGVPLTWATLTFDQYVSLLTADPAVGRAFGNSLALASITATVSAVVAIPLAYLAVIRRQPLARLADGLVEIPYALPGIVLALGVIVVFLPPLPIIGLSLYNSFGILLVAYLARFLLLVQRPVAAAMSALDPALEDAARVVGAGQMSRLLLVIGPTVLPSAIAGAFMIFMTALNELTVSALLWSSGNETLGVMVFQLQYQGSSEKASALACLSILLTLALAALAGLIQRQRFEPKRSQP